MIQHTAYLLEIANDRRNTLIAEADDDRLARSVRRHRRLPWRRSVRDGTGARPAVARVDIAGFAGATESTRRQVRRTPVPSADSPAFCDWATAFAHQIADHGFAGMERRVAELARVAREAAVSTTMVAIMADRAQPEPARQRAFGEILVAMIDRAPCSTDGPRRDDVVA